MSLYLRVLLEQIEPIKQTRDNESDHSYFFSLPVPDNQIYNFLIGELPENNILNGYKRTVSENGETLTELNCSLALLDDYTYVLFEQEARKVAKKNSISVTLGRSNKSVKLESINSESALVCLPINQKGQGYSFFINDAKENLTTAPLSTIIGYVGNIELLPRAIEIEYGLKPIESMGKVKN